MSNLLKKEKGFTLIEIVLVLAIAGLLLVIVFLAVSGAQKSRRDSQRKNDASAYAAALEQYASNNTGQYPATGAALAGTYFSRNDPQTGTAYTVIGTADAATVVVGKIGYVLGDICASGVGVAGKANNYAVVVGTEQGGTYCVDNH